MTKNRQVQTCLHLQKDKNFNELFCNNLVKNITNIYFNMLSIQFENTAPSISQTNILFDKTA